KLDRLADAIVGSDFEGALNRLAWYFRIREKQTRDSVLEMAEKAPLWSMMPATVMGADGFTQATIHSIEDDLDGRSIQYAADLLNWNAPFLSFAFDRIKQKHGLDLEALLAHITAAPF